MLSCQQNNGTGFSISCVAAPACMSLRKKIASDLSRPERRGETALPDGPAIKGRPMRGGGAPKNGGQACQALGRSRGGFSTKIHVSVDGLGNPLRFILTGGQRHDITQAEELIAGYAGEQVLADKGYDSQSLLRDSQPESPHPANAHPTLALV